MMGSARVQVCAGFKAFLSLHAVTKKRIERLGKAQGIIDNVKQVLPEETKLLIRQHIGSFPNKESHYLGKPTCNLDATLNLKDMYQATKKVRVVYPLIVDLQNHANFFGCLI